MLEKVIRKPTLDKALRELSLELNTLIGIRKHWHKTMRILYNKIKKKKNITNGIEQVNGFISCLVIIKLDEEIPYLRNRIKRIKKLINKKTQYATNRFKSRNGKKTKAKKKY